MITPQLLAHYQKTRDACHHRLTGHPPMTMVEQLASISEQARQYDSQDYYGQGELIESFETDIATLLGKESAVFLPSGTMAPKGISRNRRSGDCDNGSTRSCLRR